MKILQISTGMPYPPTSGKPLRDFNLLRSVASQCRVTHLCLASAADDSLSEPVRDLCERLIVVPDQPTRAWSRPGLALSYVLRGRPPELRSYWSSELAAKVASLTRDEHFDVIEMINSEMALYREMVEPKSRGRCMVTLHDVTFGKVARIAGLEPRFARRQRLRLHARAMRRWEPRYLEHFARSIVVSEQEKRNLLEINPRLKLSVVPNGIDTEAHTPLPPPESSGPPSLLFVGNFAYRPNIDAAIWFCSEVLPRVRERIPQAELWIVGREPDPLVQRLAELEQVHVTGAVEDVQPYYGSCTMAVVPLRAGGGTRIKILESMALGRPVVSTTVGCEGLDLTPGTDLLVSDTAAGMASAIASLAEDRDLAGRLITSGRSRVEQEYDWRSLGERLVKVYEEVAAV